MTACEKCGNTTIIYYRQIRKDGVTVVTARCANGHHPITGKPFYSISQFDISSLPLLGGSEPKQIELPKAETERPQTLLEWFEWKRNLK